MASNARNACVIGWPVAHSLSPKLHGRWLAAHRIPARYEAWEIRPEGLAEALSELVRRQYAGCNLTLPHKELVLPLLADMDAPARAIGAANTIVVRPGGALYGMNTDAFGFTENLRAHGALARRGKAVVLGAGGAARAVVWALAQEGFSPVILLNRTQDKAQALARHVAGPCAAAPWETRQAALDQAALLVNATSLGMRGKPPLELDLSMLPVSAAVADLVYAPLETPLLAAARARGNLAVGGLGMLIWQAVPAFEAWYGVRPQVEAGMEAWLAA